MNNKLADLLDRPIAFHRALVPVVGGVLPALMLSQAIYWTKRTSGADPDRWFWKTQQEWEKETGMGRREQETARARLRETLFWKEKLRGIPARMFFFVDMDLLMAALLGQGGQSSMAESAILERRKAPIKKGAKRHTIYTETTIETTTENTHTKAKACVCDGPLDHPMEQKNPAGQGGEQGQEALVEAAFQNAVQQGEIRNPAAYRAALARAAARGELVAPIAPPVSHATRRHEQRRAAALEWARNYQKQLDDKGG